VFDLKGSVFGVKCTCWVVMDCDFSGHSHGVEGRVWL